MLAKRRLVYWAGFFDGEGHIELDYRNPTYSSRYGAYIFEVTIDQWTKEPYVFFAELLENFGGSIIKQKKSPNNFRWFIAGKKGRQFLEALLPDLRKKRRLAELAIEFQKRLYKGCRLQEAEIHARDVIIEEYFTLIERTKPKRILKLGRHTLLERKRTIKKRNVTKEVRGG